MILVDSLTPTIGAIVSGIDLATVEDTQIGRLHNAWAEHLVLFVHDQHLECEQLVAFAKRFGDLYIHPTGGVPGYPGLVVVRND